MFKLPEGYRPDRTLAFAVQASSSSTFNIATLQIRANGEVLFSNVIDQQQFERNGASINAVFSITPTAKNQKPIDNQALATIDLLNLRIAQLEARFEHFTDIE